MIRITIMDVVLINISDTYPVARLKYKDTEVYVSRADTVVSPQSVVAFELNEDDGVTFNNVSDAFDYAIREVFKIDEVAYAKVHCGESEPRAGFMSWLNGKRWKEESAWHKEVMEALPKTKSIVRSKYEYLRKGGKTRHRRQ